MDNNSFTNLLESTKSPGQPVYTCGLCYKDFLYYRDLAVHERMHLEQMTLPTGGLQGGIRQPTYENRTGLYNSGSVPLAPLESFDKLTQQFRGEPDMRMGHTDMRSPIPTSSATDMDKGSQGYRTEADNRSVVLDNRSTPIDSRGLNMDMRSLPVDNRTLPMDSRSMPLDARNMQPVDSRGIVTDTRSLPVDSRALAYSSAPYLDTVNRPMYTQDLSNKIQTSTPPTFQVQPGLRPDDYLPMENRNQNLPKLDSQIYSKPDPYYSIPKTHYPSLGGVEKTHPNYAPQYNLSKLLSQAPAPYYPQPLGGQGQSKYDMEKIPSPPSISYYNQPVISQPDPKLEKRQPSPSPKQTLYYGQPPIPSHPVSMATNSHYQISLPKPSHIPLQNTREIINKFPEKPEVSRSYQSGHASPHLTYTDIYKGSQPQTQVFTPVPSQPAPVQHDYSYYKLSVEPVPTVNIDSKPMSVGLQECECYVCFAPFPDMNELSEHMKIHAREGIAMENATQVGTPSPQPPISTNNVVNVNNTYTSMSPDPVVSVSNNVHISTAAPPAVAFKAKDNLTCHTCGKTFLKASFLAEHMKVHSVEQQQFECKVCKVVFNKKSKCLRHEALHQRNIKLFYCEICEKDFSYKGNYLYHVQVEHSKDGSESKVSSMEPKPLVDSTVSKIVQKADHEIEKIIDCQVCDAEIGKNQLVEHLTSHTVHTCDKCDRVFVQKTEYVEHLMTDHWRELADSSDTKSGSENSDNEKQDASKSGRTREESEDKDSGLEEDHEKDKEESLPDVSSGKKEVEDTEKTAAAKMIDQMKDLEEKKKEVMKNLKEIKKIEKMKKKKEAKNLKEKQDRESEKALESESSFAKETKLKFSCSKCDESFAKKSELAQHVEIHTRDPMKVYCEVCSMAFPMREKGYYMYHMKQHSDRDLDNGKQPAQLTCYVCYSVVKREKLVSHVVEEHTKFSCDICLWSYSSESSLFNHMKKIHSNKKVKYILKSGGGIEIQQKQVPVVYKKLKDITPMENETYTASSENVFTCKICSKTFNKKGSVEKHMKIKHISKSDEQHMNCEICSASFSSRGTYFYHVLNDHKNSGGNTPQVCKEIEEKGDNKERMEESQERCVVTVLNPVTGDLEERVEYENHEEKGQQLDATNNAEVKDDSSSKKASDVVSEILYCKLCNQCLKRDTLYEHMKVHCFYNCDLCKYSFTKKPTYLHHRKMLHSDEIVTSEIEKIEMEEKQHNKATDTGKRKRTDIIKLLTCPICAAEFRQDKYLQHMGSHRKTKLQCQFCCREFSKKNILVLHEKSHERVSHLENELPFPKSCPICNVSIKSRESYIQHHSEHFKLKAFTCKTCSINFTSEKILENHTRVYHDVNIRVVWTFDGEGLKFDVRTGRYGEVVSDYLSEIRELNELLKANKKAEIWFSTTPKKGREKGANTSVSKVQDVKYIDDEEALKLEDEENEKAKVDTSDEDYVPEGKRKSESSDVDEGDEEYKPSSKKKKKRKSTYSADDDDDDDDDEEVSTSEEEYTHKGTRTRKTVVSKKALHKLKRLRIRQKKKPLRVLRSTVPIGSKIKEAANKNKDNADTDTKAKPPSESVRRHLKRKPVDDTEISESPSVQSPKKSKAPTSSAVQMTPEQIQKFKLKPGEKYRKSCPVCSTRTWNKRHYEEHLRTHSGEKPYKCPVCESAFNREWNRSVHIEKMHKDYKPVSSPVKAETNSPATGKAKEMQSPSTPRNQRESRSSGTPTLRTRSRTVTEEEPMSASTPIKGSKLMVRISPLQMPDKLEKSPVIEKKSSPVIEKKSTPRSKSTSEKTSSEKKPNTVQVCEYCNKAISNKWNYTQHVETHKKELKKKEKESKPFSCKTCSESFKKKRDLYIHTKIHSNSPVNDEDSVMDVSKTESELNDTGDISMTSSVPDSEMSMAKDCDTSMGCNAAESEAMATSSQDECDDKDISSIGSTSSNNTGDRSLNGGNVKNLNGNIMSSSNKARKNQGKEVESEVVKSNNDSVTVTETVSEKSKNGPKSSYNSSRSKTNNVRDSLENTDTDKQSEESVSTSSKKSETNSKPDLAAQNKGNNGEKASEDDKVETESPTSEQESLKEKTQKRSSPIPGDSDAELSNNDTAHKNNNSDVKRLSDSETEDKSKSTKTPPPVKKMSFESALSKWKMKVRSTQSSQLELNAVKEQEEMDNPEIAKVKERLAIKGKIEKKKFECRICGDMLDQENKFREHMEVHLNESPPYCSICDIYFMAIYPKRRLMEHNKKKHPELQS